MASYRERVYENYASGFQDADATFNIEAARRWGRAYRSYFQGWLPHAQSRVLDLGCGWGRLLQFYVDLSYKDVTGVDLSPEQTAIARQTSAKVHNANALDFLSAATPGSFDLISSLDVIEHLQKDEALKFLDLCFRALAKNGRIILQTPNADSPWGTSHRYNDFTHELGFNPNSLERILALAGFRALESRELGPIGLGYSLISSARWAIWQTIRQGLKVWNYAETGNGGSGVFTRIFVVSGIKTVE